MMFSFHVDRDLDILLEKLTAQIGTQHGSGTQFRLETPGNLLVDIVKM